MTTGKLEIMYVFLLNRVSLGTCLPFPLWEAVGSVVSAVMCSLPGFLSSLDNRTEAVFLGSSPVRCALLPSSGSSSKLSSSAKFHLCDGTEPNLVSWNTFGPRPFIPLTYYPVVILVYSKSLYRNSFKNGLAPSYYLLNKYQYN